MAIFEDKKWVLIDTETNGISDPIHVVELAAQLMQGWQPIGQPFQVLLNKNIEITPEVSRLNGYTREILERDGIDPGLAYSKFKKYVKAYPIVSYNLDFDWDRVLVQEWARLGIQQIGTRGFCVLRLAQRLLDPVPAGNHKLQTLRQFYRLPDRGAHSAMGDVMTVIDLCERVLLPLIEKNGMSTWEDVVAFTEEEWYPSVLTFGKFKGRAFREAMHDPDLAEWLEWLSESKNERSSAMGKWYLRNISVVSEDEELTVTHIDIGSSKHQQNKDTTRSGIVVYQDIELQAIKKLVDAARERLADLESIYSAESNKVAVVNSSLFKLLSAEYRKRDQLSRIIKYRKRFLDSFYSHSDHEEDIFEGYEEEEKNSNKEYEEAESAAESVQELTQEQKTDLKKIYKKLASLYHPDRAQSDVEIKAYTVLMSAINLAKEKNDIEMLRKIANDPDSILQEAGEVTLGIRDRDDVSDLKRVYQVLQVKIVEIISKINDLKEDPQYELATLVERKPSYLDETAEEMKKELLEEISSLEVESSHLAREIAELTGDLPRDGCVF